MVRSILKGMQVVTQLPDAAAPPPRVAIALGTFDGVHVGHQTVLRSARQAAQQHGLASAVWTFANHPHSVVSATAPKQLTTLQERLALMAAMGFEVAYVIPFDETVRQIDPETFLTEWLWARCGVRHISVGYDFCFGRNRAGNSALLRQWGQTQGVGISVLPALALHCQGTEQVVSSTLIRKLVAYGQVAEAAERLGRPYTLTAPVVRGFQRGRQLGFPTANLDMALLVHHHRVLPALGVYAGWATVEGWDRPVMAVANLGLSPTFETVEPAERLEIHLLDVLEPLTGETLYGKTLSFAFAHHLREERWFPSKEALVAQITADCDHARARLVQAPPPPLQWVSCPSSEGMLCSATKA
ncbi:MAG: riboflavin biosynthesis protein RibF [Vampirovibrionales bacterium]